MTIAINEQTVAGTLTPFWTRVWTQRELLSSILNFEAAALTRIGHGVASVESTVGIESCMVERPTGWYVHTFNSSTIKQEYVQIPSFIVGDNYVGENIQLWSIPAVTGLRPFILQTSSDWQTATILCYGQDYFLQDDRIVFYKDPRSMFTPKGSILNGQPVLEYRCWCRGCLGAVPYLAQIYGEPLGIRMPSTPQLQRLLTYAWRSYSEGLTEENLNGLLCSAYNTDICKVTGTIVAQWSDALYNYCSVSDILHKAPISKDFLYAVGAEVSKGELLFDMGFDIVPGAINCKMLGGLDVTIHNSKILPQRNSYGKPLPPCSGPDKAAYYALLDTDDTVVIGFLDMFETSDVRVNTLEVMLDMLGTRLQLYTLLVTDLDELLLQQALHILRDTRTAGGSILFFINTDSILETNTLTETTADPVSYISYTGTEDVPPCTVGAVRFASNIF